MTKNIKARVDKVVPLTNSILQIMLTPEEFINYKSGQYLKINLDDKELSYSIANAPLGARNYELHIKHIKDNPLHIKLIEEIRTRGFLNITLPFGTCHIDNLRSDLPITFIAGGTGFAPVKAMIEQKLFVNDALKLELFWAVRTKSDLYMEDLIFNWQSHVENFKYFTVLSQTGRKILQDKIFARHSVQEDFKAMQFVISGPFEFACDIKEWLLQLGAIKENLFSDAFNL